MQMWPGERSPGTDVAGVSPRSARNVDEVEEEGAAVLRRPRERVGEENHQLVEVEDGRVLVVVLMSHSRTHRADNRTDAKETSNSRVLPTRTDISPCVVSCDTFSAKSFMLIFCWSFLAAPLPLVSRRACTHRAAGPLPW